MPASRPYWKGYLKLSFVSCPIALYPAISAAERISFRQVNRRTGHRIKQKLVDSVTGEAVEAAARGYEVGENEFLLVEDRDLEQARREHRGPGEVEVATPPRRESAPIVPAIPRGEPAEDAADYDDEEQENRLLFKGRRTRARSKSSVSFPPGRSTRGISRSRTTSGRARKLAGNLLR
ncbi:Ku protein [Bradyrhizobium paxllaeri]|uniref:Ku protein n=1 Tax=Bradyrhizobium paxllaeri TaxID=190148 RepID=UPI000810BF95|nr:Ku protein [Bradyrhizobium paxllaeri]